MTSDRRPDGAVLQADVDADCRRNLSVAWEGDYVSSGATISDPW